MRLRVENVHLHTTPYRIQPPVSRKTHFVLDDTEPFLWKSDTETYTNNF